MSDPLVLPRSDLPPTNEPLRTAARRLRWFRAAFRRVVTRVAEDLGCTFEIDDAKLAAIFMRWLEELDRQRPQERAERAAFLEFASSLCFRALIADLPLRALSAPARPSADEPGQFWPEAYACTIFCLSVHSAAVEQEFHVVPQLSPEATELRSWWSFRENVREDTAFSAGFLQKILGHEPNWFMPDNFRSRLGHWLFDPEDASGG